MNNTFNVEVANPATSEIDAYARPLSRIGPDGKRQIKVHKKTGHVMLQNSGGFTVLSALRKGEWELLEAAVFDAARLSYVGMADLRAKGLVKSVPFEAVISQWNTSSEMTAADESITGESRGTRGAVDFGLAGVPVPVVFKEFNIPQRLLLASRRAGQSIDTVSAFEASQAVAEKREQILFDGSGIRIGSNILYGYTNHPNILTDTATNYGGGDWGTATNITPTIVGMIAAASTTTNRFRGPYMLYVAPVQYNQAALAFPSVDNNSTFLDRINSIAAIEGIKSADFLADGEVLLVQMTQNVIDYVEAFDIQMVEWSSGDGMSSMFKVMAVGAPRVKSTHGTQSGIVLATGA